MNGWVQLPLSSNSLASWGFVKVYWCRNAEEKKKLRGLSLLSKVYPFKLPMK